MTDTLRKVLVDTEGMVPGDLVQWTGEHFEKFTPTADWQDLDMPDGWQGIWDAFHDPEDPEAFPPTPPYQARLDGLGGVSVRGAFVVNMTTEILDAMTSEGGGPGLELGTMPEALRPHYSVIFDAAIGIVSDGIIFYQSFYTVLPSGKIYLQPGTKSQAGESFTDLLPGNTVVLQVNGHYDKLD